MRSAIRLSPKTSLAAVDCDGWEWFSEDGDPQFHVRLHWLRRLQRGWYMVELQLDAEPSSGVARFFFDTGGGFQADESLMLPYRGGKLCKRLVFLRAAPRAVRFDPMESPGRFSVRHLRFAHVTRRFAIDRMLGRVQRRYPGFDNTDTALIRAQIDDDSQRVGRPWIDSLIALYDETFLRQRSGVTYQDWIEVHERRLVLGLAEAAAEAAPTRPQPTILILVDARGSGRSALERCFRSIIGQRYEHWDLCVLSLEDDRGQVVKALKASGFDANRARVLTASGDAGAAAAFRAAVDGAGDEYLAFIRHDHELAAHALDFVVRALERRPEAQILYSDEDVIDLQESRRDPHFKPDWNPDLLLSHNYLSQLCVFRADLVRRVGGIRQGFEGAEDYDLLLRCMPYMQPSGVVHIPTILCHRRAGDENVGASLRTADAAGLRAVEQHVERMGLDTVVERGLQPLTYRVRYRLPNPAPLVSLLIPTRDRLDLLGTCVTSILERTEYPALEVIVIDNQSREAATLEWLDRASSDPRIRVLRYDQPFNFSAICNFGVANARGQIVGLVNNDVEVISCGWLSEMASQALRPEIGCVGAKLYYEDGTIQHAGVILGLGGVAGHGHRYFDRDAPGYFNRLMVVQNLSAVTGACLVVRKSVYLEVGGLNERELQVALNDVDFCLRVRQAGYRNLWTPYAELYHHESRSRGADDTPEKRARFAAEFQYMKAKWGDLLTNDPAYSPHLTREREDFSL